MIQRSLTSKIDILKTQFPVLALLGPRQSGKTTLAKTAFPNHKYLSLEDFDVRNEAQEDPRGFLASLEKEEGIILDEIQHAPQLTSYIQTTVDHDNRAGRFVITGSQNFLVTESVSQSLAGRAAILTLLPFSIQELSTAQALPEKPEDAIFKGFFPRLYDKPIDPQDLYPSYLRSYIERDVRMIKNITDLSLFQRFLKLCAGRIGQLLNLSSLCNDCGISVPTAKGWLSVLESSYIVYLLQPYHNNFSKRLVKSPKLYFYDTGLACSLLGIQSSEQLSSHYLRGGLFESLIISDLYKHRLNQGREPQLYFWRDRSGNEVDCIIETGTTLVPVEIKSGKTTSSSFFENLEYWKNLTNQPEKLGAVIYAGDQNKQYKEWDVLKWKSATKILEKVNM